MGDKIEAQEQNLSLKNMEVEVDESPATVPVELKPEDKIPSMIDSDWSDYVLKQFEEDEMIDGNPTVDGLRRVAKKLLGDIIESTCNVISSPTPANDFSSTVEHIVIIEWTRDTQTPGYRRFKEVADVNLLNCDPEFRRFASSTASTRAEARALRKALMLKRVVAAEEITEIAPETEDGKKSDKITKAQMNFLVLICKRNNINIMNYINMGTNKFDRLEDVPYNLAIKMSGVLSEYQRKPEKIKDSIKGWKDDWNKK